MGDMSPAPYELYEDHIRPVSQVDTATEARSAYRDLVYYDSSVTPGLRLAAVITKPDKPSYVLASTHAWHGSMPQFSPLAAPDPTNHYLRVEVDMRGRAFSTGDPDCNGWELHDIIDAINYAREHYADYLVDPDVVYFEAGSGGGGNALALAGKFPDYFAAITALCPISDYDMWYRNDRTGEFRDEMDVWIGCRPNENPMAYRSRSGLALIGNLHSPLFIAHGETDERVPATHSRQYVAASAQRRKQGLVSYHELRGVGTASHWGNASTQQLDRVARTAERQRATHRRPVTIPPRGEFVVGGYLVTKPFSITLESLDHVATVSYDLTRRDIHMIGRYPGRYSVTWHD